jgi:hypothetical protein
VRSREDSRSNVSLRRRKSLIFIVSLLERERRNHLAAGAKQIRPRSCFDRLKALSLPPKGGRSGSVASQPGCSVIVLIGAQSVARSTSHYSVDGTTIVAGPSKLLLETDNVRSVTIVAVAAVITAGGVPVAVVAIAIVAGAIAIVTRPVPVVTGAIPVTVGIIAIAVRVISIAVAIGVAEEREAKAAYENEIIKVIVVAVMPIAAIPIAAIPIATVE